MSNFTARQHHQWTLEELDNMMPWERNVYLTLLSEYVKEENERLKRQQNANKGKIHG